jgi:hypothetical protein
MADNPTLPGDDLNFDEPDEHPTDFGDHPDEGVFLPEPPHPIDWNLLTADDAEQEWWALNGWVDWLRHTYGLPVTIIPPYWHRHPELVWELSALHLHWLGSYDPTQNGSAPIGWHTDFATARERLRDWVALSGTKLDRDRPTRQTVWPGEEPATVTEEHVIANRRNDFAQFVTVDVDRRRAAEDEFYRRIADKGVRG